MATIARRAAPVSEPGIRKPSRELRELWLERVLLPLNVRHLHGPRRVDCPESEAIVVCLERNAEPYLASFIDHYLGLGARHIVLLDNGSRDGTLAEAARHDRVSVFGTSLPFKDNNASMRRYLIRRFGQAGRWVLCVDVDELFDYPCSDRVPLASLLAYLRSRSYTAMVAYLLDMFSDGPLSAPPPRDVPLREACPYYDLSAVRKRGYFEEDGYGGQRFVRHNTLANPDVGRYVGGVRSGAFDLPEVYLIKHPLLFQDGQVRLSHQHFVDHASVADVTGVLYHYKFVGGFAARVDAAVREGAYADGSWEYRRYRRALDEKPDLCLKGEAARRLRGVDELVDQGFLHVTPAYREWAERN